jgi:hypothetical protein
MIDDKELRHHIKLLRVEYPDAHFYSLALKIQAQTGHIVTGQKVRQILLEPKP